MSANAETTQAPRPGSDEVLRELVSLRKDVGATYPRIRKYCSKTMRLPIVDDQIELERTSIHPDDRHIGLHRAIGCVLDNKFHSLRDVAIVVGTLRFDTAHMDFKLAEGHYDDRDRLLGQREEALKRFYKLEKTRFEEIRNNAYLLLADELASAERSPCRRGGFTKAFERDLSSADNEVLLLSLSIIKDPIHTEAIINELRLRLSRVNKLPNDAEASAVFEVIKATWLELFLKTGWPQYRGQIQRSVPRLVFTYKVTHEIVRSASFIFEPKGFVEVLLGESGVFFDEGIARFGRVVTYGRDVRQTHSRYPTIEWEVRTTAWADLAKRLTRRLFAVKTPPTSEEHQPARLPEEVQKAARPDEPAPIVEFLEERFS